MSRKKSAKKAVAPTGLTEIDRLGPLTPCRIEDYLAGVSSYIRHVNSLAAGPKKAAQIRLSNALARSFAADICERVPALRGRLVTEEQKVAGGLRTANADVSESHSLDGLRLAVELKPVNLAVGRAIWNRFGDLRTFSVNIHLKFPFAVVGGVLVIPTYEETGTKAAVEAELEEAFDPESKTTPQPDGRVQELTPTYGRKSTIHLIEKAIERLIRAGGRRSEADAAHLLEGISVVVYDPDTSELHPELPRRGSGLRWDEFIATLASAYETRFEA